jgi:hypothetical protein
MAEQVNPTSVKFPVKPELPGGILVPWEELSVAVDGPTEVQNLALDEESGQVFVSFETDITGQYLVYVRHNDQDLNRTPVTINVHKKGDSAPPPKSTTPRGETNGPKARTIRFKVPSCGLDPSGMTVQIEEGPDHPSQTNVEKEGDELSVSIHISKPGKYVVAVRKNGSPIPKSPFTINVPDSAFKF